MHIENKVCTKFQQRAKTGRPSCNSNRPLRARCMPNSSNMQHLEDPHTIFNTSTNFKPLAPARFCKVPIQQHWLAGTDVLSFCGPLDKALTQSTANKSHEEATQNPHSMRCIKHVICPKNKCLQTPVNPGLLAHINPH